jgi:acetyltransferase-like isoleucine patch superfamily enzyme
MSGSGVVREGTIVYPGSEIGLNFTTGHYALIREESIIGKNVSVGSFTEIGPHCMIGDGVRIHSRCFIPEFTVIKAGAWLGPGVIITNTHHPLCKFAKGCLPYTSVFIGEGAIVGAGVLILPGRKIGAHSLVAAGAIVLKDVEPNTTAIGGQDVASPRCDLTCKLGAAYRQEIGVPDEFRPYPVD